jgi:membrane-associated phospholipid phosphatase
MRPSILRLILIATIFSLSVSLFLTIAHELFGEKEDQFDDTVLHYVSSHLPSDRIRSSMVMISFFASGNFLVSCYVCLYVYYAVLKKRRSLAFYVLSTGLSGFLVNVLLKLLFHRQRPANPLIAPPKDFSFPSGHATAAFIFYGLIVYLLWRSHLEIWLKYLLSACLVLFSVAIGFSRIFLRVHYPTDVLAGFCIGIAWLSLSFYLYGKWNGTFPDKHQSRHQLTS